MFGLTVIGHLSMVRNHALLESTVVYVEAYRAGLAAAQERVRAICIDLLIPYGCLSAMSLVAAHRVSSSSSGGHSRVGSNQ